jgi:hypothetical protein
LRFRKGHWTLELERLHSILVLIGVYKNFLCGHFF